MSGGVDGAGRGEGTEGADRNGAGRSEGTEGADRNGAGRGEGTEGADRNGPGHTGGTEGADRNGPGRSEGTEGADRNGPGFTTRHGSREEETVVPGMPTPPAPAAPNPPAEVIPAGSPAAPAGPPAAPATSTGTPPAAPPGPAVLTLEGVGRTYTGRGRPLRVLDDISFSIPQGAFWSIVGPSGSGKSTLLSLISGLALPTEGRVLVGGRPLTGPDPQAVTLIFQELILLPWRTALDNVAFPLELRGVPPSVRRERAADLLHLVGLEAAADRHPHELSGGMRQRVAIARGLILDPTILLMDEPFGSLDEQTRTHMGAELLRIWERTGKTILFVTHSLSEAIYLSDRVLVLKGRPARIVEQMDIGLRRPRPIDVMGEPEFGRLRNRIWAHLAAET